MEFRQIVAYHGPNRWSGVPTLEVVVDLGIRSGWRTSDDPSAISRLMSWLPALEAPPQFSETADDAPLQESFSQRAQRGLPMSDVLRRVTCLLESAAGTPPNYSRCVESKDGQTFQLMFEFEEEPLGRACLETARQCVLAALTDTPFDAPAEIRKLVNLADDERLGPSTRAILRAAASRGVPCRRLNSGSLVQLGEGRKQHRIWTAETDQTSSIGEDIAQDKELTKRLLRQVGVPVPRGQVVQTSEEACAAAKEIGFPIVIKPRDANHGRGISFDLMTCEEIEEAFDLARRENKTGTTGVIIERFARGAAHRLLVVGDRLIAAARGQDESVIGDGIQTISELVEEANRDPLRGENYTDPLSPMELDEITLLELKRNSLTPDSIPEAGHKVIIKYNGDLTTDETAQVHPAVAERAVLAAQTVGLNIAGLDVIAAEISRPLEEQGGMIIEVNAGPSLLMHVEPLHGQPQPVGDAIVELMFPGGEDGRIPLIGLACGSETAAIGRLIAGMFRKVGRRVGTAVDREVQVDGQRPYLLRGSDQDRVRSLLLHPLVEAAIFECHSEELLSIGLGCDRCDVAVLTSLASASSEAPIDDVLSLVHSVPPEGATIVPETAPHIDRLQAACPGHTVLYSVNGETDRLRDHQARGGRVAFFLDDSLILGSGPSAFFMPLKGMETSGSVVREQLLPAVAAAWSAGVPVELLRDILSRTGL